MNTITTKLLGRLRNVTQAGDGWKACCPAHENRNPSLSISEASDRVLIRCFAGCSPQAVVEAVGMSISDLFIDTRTNGQARTKSAKPGKVFGTADEAIGVWSRLLGKKTAGEWQYRDAQGELVAVAIRFDQPDGSKEFRPVSRNGSGWVLKAPATPRPLYRLDELVKLPPETRIYIGEGERPTDAAWSVGLPATTSFGGSQAATRTDWTPLAGRDVVILPDYDDPGGKYARDVMRLLARLSPRPTVRVVELPNLPVGGDIVEHIAARVAAGDSSSIIRDAIDEMAEAAAVIEPPTDKKAKDSGDGDDEKRPKKSAATRAVELAQATQFALWHTPAGDAFTSIRREGHVEHWAVMGREFRRWLTGLYYKVTQDAMTVEAITGALNVIAAQAVCDGDEHDAFVRVAKFDGKIYVDLCNSTWQVVEVGSDGWRVLNTPPVRFRRFKAMLPLPNPERGGRIDDLRQLVNVTDSTWPLVVGWLLVCFLPESKYPLLALFAEQGSGKTTAARLLRALIDPNISPLRSEPRKEENLIIAANNSWVVAFDNLSSIPDWLSDALCRLATGGGFSTRTLYTNDEETIFSVTRPTMLTSIEDVASRSDLLDRCVVAHLPTIPSDQRKTEAELQAAFTEMQPRLLGALLDAVAVGLKREHDVRPERLPRMADFAKWVIACEPGLGWPPGTFMAAYDDNRSEANELALESSLIWKPLSELLAERNEWRGTAGELKKTLEDRMNANPPKDWPKSAKAIGGAVRRIAPNVRVLGWTVSFSEREPDGHRRKIIVINKDLP